MRYLITLAVLALSVGPAAARDKEYILDTRTGKVSQKDAEQDKQIADLKAEVAALKAKLSPTAPGVAAADPFAAAARADCKCGLECTCTTRDTTARGVADTSTSKPAPARSEELTYTVAPRGTSGITSGCAGGSCGVQVGGRVGLFRRR